MAFIKMTKLSDVYDPLRSKSKHGPGFSKTVIAARCEDCAQKFTRLCELVASRFSENIAASLGDRLTQFITWGNETGAMDKDLDHRLRDSTDMRDIIVDILTQLQSLLDQGRCRRHAIFILLS